MASLKIVQKNSRPHHLHTCGEVDHCRVRNDVVDKHSKLSPCHDGRVDHIGRGRAYRGIAMRMLIHEKEIRVITTSGELLKELTFDEEKNYQPQ